LAGLNGDIGKWTAPVLFGRVLSDNPPIGKMLLRAVFDRYCRRPRTRWEWRKTADGWTLAKLTGSSRPEYNRAKSNIGKRKVNGGF
jgi:hypothetical protein